MKPIRFVMIGGFLGAGKTTAIGRLARAYTDAGLRVGIVTNDQAYDLVDTKSLRAQGFRVGEVPGACFCCKFDDLVETAAALSADERPDVIITEPVGSCTDLVATVIEPLRHLHGDTYDIAPLAVLLKPEHGRKILGGAAGGGFSPKAAYIFLKQIEEADVVVINKVGTAEPRDVDTVEQNIRRINPAASIIRANSPVTVDDPGMIKGKRVLVVEDGPTLTHGDMKIGAGHIAATQHGAAEIGDPRPYAVGSIREVYKKYSHLTEILPAMGHGSKQVSELASTINAADCDLVLIGTPSDLGSLLKINKPSMRVRYELDEESTAPLRRAIEEALSKKL